MWIQSLVRSGLIPEIRIIEEIPDDRDWESREIHWIAHYKYIGCDLTNFTSGGEGAASYGRLGKKNSLEHKLKCSAARTGVSIKQRDPNGLRAAHLRKLNETLAANGYPSWGNHSEEHKAKMRSLGKSDIYLKNMAAAAKASAEARKGKPAANRGVPASEDTKAKISLAKKGKPWTESRRLAQQLKKGKTND